MVDSLIQELDGNVFVDAKGVEVGHFGMTSHRSEVVADKTKTSVIKGISQALETAASLVGREGFRIEADRNYLLVVTFKPLSLGAGI